MQEADARPSGCFITVRKRFPKKEEFWFALEFHKDYPSIMLPMANTDHANLALEFPIGARMNEALRPEIAIAQLLKKYHTLWCMTERRTCDRVVYHNYVMRDAANTDPRLIHAITNLWEHVKDAPITEFGLVHGDATLANAIVHKYDVCLIDPSPRPSPGERIIDQAKLMMSTQNIDGVYDINMIMALEAALHELSPSDFRGGYVVSPKAAYYFVSHLIRVQLREPGKTNQLLSCLNRIDKGLLHGRL